ncbi:MAG: DUF3095 domain-containing protein [Synechococcales cyanobacterium]
MDFFDTIPTFQAWRDLQVAEDLPPLPDDWLLLLTDIQGSTRAIEAGRYKEVNLIAAASIAAVLNVDRQIGIPFVFGGDGASLAIPPHLQEPASLALLATQRMAAEKFGLTLRVGQVPVGEVYRAGYGLRMGRLQISDHFQQAIFWGGGLTYAEKLLKDPQAQVRYQLRDPGGLLHADYSGLECRWQDVRSPKGEMISLMVEAQSLETYQGVFRQLERTYGSRAQRRPVLPQQLNLTFRHDRLSLEAKVHQRDPEELWRENLLGQVLMGLKLTVGKMPWGQYKELLSLTTDHEKLDDVLRVVVTGSPSQRQELCAYLEQGYEQGSLVYGVHVSDRGLLTCLVFERHGQQVHFVDTADGGYALAAKAMKTRRSQLTARHPQLTQ